MTDHYLRTVSESAMQTALQGAGLYTPTSGYSLASMTHGLVIIGTLYKPMVTVVLGQTTISLVAVMGFHANLRLLSGSLPTSLTSLVISNPTTPSVMWA